MDNSNLIEDIMQAADNVIFRAISEIRGKSKRPNEARIYNIFKHFLDEVSVFDGSFWERMKTLEDERAIINRPTKRGSSFFLSKSLHKLADNNSNIVNTTSAVYLSKNTTVCPNFDADISLLSEGIDSLEQFFKTQLQNPTQMSSVKSTSKGTNTNKERYIN